LTQDEAVRIAQAIDEIITDSKSIKDFKRDLNWLKDNVLGSVTTKKIKQKRGYVKWQHQLKIPIQK
jgi:hypothetical protein